jgi:hypothetical protein
MTPGIGNDHIERFAGGEKLVGCGAGAGERRKVELNELEAAAVVCGVFTDLRRSALGFPEVACGAKDVGAVGDKRAGGFYAEARGDASYEDSLAF